MHTHFVGFVMSWLISLRLNLIFVYNSLVAICWERAILLAFHLYCVLLYVFLVFMSVFWGERRLFGFTAKSIIR